MKQTLRLGAGKVVQQIETLPVRKSQQRFNSLQQYRALAEASGT